MLRFSSARGLYEDPQHEAAKETPRPGFRIMEVVPEDGLRPEQVDDDSDAGGRVAGAHQQVERLRGACRVANERGGHSVDVVEFAARLPMI
ncbi:MAG: hypothetical protein DMD55_19330 [Gemmatimonadetes bacterium]|nr:MAG: hypothetical protein DMD55_19330 [Gemmatimonadota bacterium]